MSWKRHVQQSIRVCKVDRELLTCEEGYIARGTLYRGGCVMVVVES